jgi:calcium-dependent protein kinase
MAAGCVEYKVREAMRQVLFGLEALHATGVVHRDIKPNNIMFKQSESLELVITDFGLSTQLDSDHPFNRCGTPGFIAPEVFKLVEKEKLKNPACDIFSIGAVFHLLLTGQPLFHASSPKDLFVKNSKMDFDFSHEKYTNLSHQGLHLMKQMLEADPQARITAKEALQHEFFHDEAKLRSPVPTFQSSNQLACNNEQEFSEIDLGTTGRKRLKGEYRKASQL